MTKRYLTRLTFRMLSAFGVVLLMLSLDGCAIAPRFVGTTQVAMTKPIIFSSIYVYSFLDIRSKELGPKMITEIQRQLEVGLKNHGVVSEQHWFENDPVASEIASTGGSERIPVREVITRNAAAERKYGARYRLIVFPIQTTTGGDWAFYDFRWTVEDTITQRVVWSTTSQGKHMNWIMTDENSSQRAKVVVDGVISEMVNSGLLMK